MVSLAVPAFTVLGVLRRSFELFGRAGLSIGLLALPCLLPLPLLALFQDSRELHGSTLALLLMLFRFFYFPLYEALVVLHCLRILDGETPSWTSTFGRVWDRYGSLWGLSFLFGLSVSAAAMLYLLPAFVVWGLFFVAVPIVVWEGGGALFALHRSMQLMLGNLPRVFAIILWIVPFTLFEWVYELEPDLWPVLVPIAILATAATTSIFAIASAVVYRDTSLIERGEILAARRGLSVPRRSAQKNPRS